MGNAIPRTENSKCQAEIVSSQCIPTQKLDDMLTKKSTEMLGSNKWQSKLGVLTLKLVASCTL